MQTYGNIYRTVLAARNAAMGKHAAAVLTPEAEQAAMQPPMPPQGMPADPAMMGAPAGAPPMDPAAAGMPPMPPPGAMPPQGAPPMDPAMAGAPTGPNGGAIPPEIMQDTMFMQFLAQAVGVMFDPATGMFMDPNGQPVPAEAIMDIYAQFQQQMAQQGGAPAGPAGPGMDPAMMGGMPPAGMEGAAAMPADQDPIGMIVTEVTKVVDDSLKAFAASTEKKISTLLDKLESLQAAVESMQDTTDRRAQQEKDAEEDLRKQLEQDLMPTEAVPGGAVIAPAEALVQKSAAITNTPINSQAPRNLFDIIRGA